ncbi:eukaryotic translation initiation factor 3 subunit D [Plasmodium brasilianum]|uniref:Eukaryotic translation initiation factor 3 subunit D n=2 Tax=Plasmodium (Plasmodium) TaxID=418103 RepID=A0A1A8X6A8_PLAMA|nr:eukaryotic translation initiation factor 3 subunit D, putative [Plasmodium malariae]KAI4838774.1 eukaryotic translation initiation factor 3 subunit D [Plasmodium brasilianum]SBT00797.1 eukaryotic translation initiation factor 3 subunit D, putative (EIF3D) [Plasmodium malariae]SCN12112.1 eukaryotic translation initiation factor 3 subunit D, putative [Plasmodium malariae]
MTAYRLVGVANNRTWGPDTKNEELVNCCMGDLKKYQFEPSMKFERIGKICDFTSSNYQKNLKDVNKNTNEGANSFEEELQFQTVDLRTGQKQKGNIYNKKKILNKQTTQAFTQKQQEEDNLYSSRIKTAEQKKQKLLLLAKTARINARHRIFTEWSIEPTPVWTVECEMMFNELPKKVIKLEQFKIDDIFFRGRVLYYDKRIENINVKNPPSLIILNKGANCLVCKTKDDQSLMEIVSDEEKNCQGYTTNSSVTTTTNSNNNNNPLLVVSTDQILACLMSCTQSKYSWHLLITKQGNKIIIDKDEDSIVDLLTVNENSIDAPTQDNENKLNSLQALGFEAIKINQRFRKQVLLKNEMAEQYDNISFLSKNSKTSDVLYRYRKINLPPLIHGTSKRNCTLITRGEIHAKIKGTNSSYIYICALNEYDIKSHKNWRSQIENQKGALLANEIRNNTSKLQKFICQALLSGCEDIKLGFISRKNANDAENHNILSIQSHKTKDLSTQIGLKYENIWGILRFIVDNISERPDGKYVILKDPLKALLRLYCTHDDDYH